MTARDLQTHDKHSVNAKHCALTHVSQRLAIGGREKISWAEDWQAFVVTKTETVQQAGQTEFSVTVEKLLGSNLYTVQGKKIFVLKIGDL